jgi:hypothetical protein
MRLTILGAALALSLPVTVAADGTSGLRHNPFSRPPLAERGGLTAAGEPTAADPAELPLRGTLTGGAESLANVGGELLAIGDEYLGWRLISIGDGEARFASGQKQITVPVAATEKENQNVLKPRN